MSDQSPQASQRQWGTDSMSSDTTVRDSSPSRGRERHRSPSLRRQIHDIDEQDAEEAYAEQDEADNRGLGALHHIRSRTRSRPDQTVIGWEPDDPENPYNWSNRRKMTVVFLTAMLVLNSTIGSALPSMAVPFIAAEFHITSTQQKVLPISVFLIGYVFGPLIWGPLSEHYGRRYLTFATFGAFAIFTMGCALSPNWPALLIFRFLCGVFASSPIAIVAGILADVYNDPRTRGRAFAIFMVTTTGGPLCAPIISGFTSPTIGWRWAFWIGLIYACATLGMITFVLPESYSPILLERRARALRKQDPSANARIVAPRELESTDLAQLLRVVLTRPLRMLIYEPIVSTTCAYLALVYTIFYMSFQAFPIIFQNLYGLSPGVTGLTYLSIGVGALFSMAIFWAWDNILYNAQQRGAPWTKREEYRRLPLACLGGPLFVISLFWLGFTAKSNITFVVPMLAGIPFGMGMMLIFMALLNYLTDAYEVFAASANAAASTCRSLLAVVLPLATAPMFADLGISGACALLGGISAVMCVIPFVFIWKGPSIRNRSRFCIALREKREELLRKQEEDRQRAERAALREKEKEQQQQQSEHALSHHESPV